MGNFSLSGVDLDAPHAHAEAIEKVLLKLRSGMMPPPGMPRPEPEEVSAFVDGIESDLDARWRQAPDPGRPVLHRLNRTEYENAVRDILDLEVDARTLLPPDDMTQGFDNMSDVLTVSPTLLEGYISAAGKISRLAVGDPDATPLVETYVVPVTFSQMRHVEGTPFGTRGGMAVRHNFPADGDYEFRISLYFRSLGPLFGDNKPAEGERVEVTVDGQRVMLFDIDRKMKQTADLRTEPFPVTAGPHVVAASFVRRMEGPVQDFVMPFDQATADLTTGNVQGLTGLPHLRNIGIAGPYAVTGVSDTPSRRKIFTCRPESNGAEATELDCAKSIVGRLARLAFRRPVSEPDLANLMQLYRHGRSGGDFDAGIRSALQAILADPEFIFRFERVPDGVRPGEDYRVSDLELASRLSFFLWSSIPDEELLAVASAGDLSKPGELERQVRRMLDDPRAETLSTNFAGHWLHLQNLQDVHPDVYVYPDWDEKLTRSMRRETELFFDSIVREDRSVLDLLTASDTFVDQRLAEHYGIPNVLGNRFRRVSIDDPERRGILGHASVLSLTSLAARTSPVIRGAWVMDVLMGTPPPRPPANVPPLKENERGEKVLSVRERMEAHRENPACAACHNIIDPIGYSLDNFDPTGAWRERDGGLEIDPSGTLFDGTQIGGAADLRAYLLRSKELYLRNFTRNLLMYAMGRVVRHQDMPVVRSIVDAAGGQDYRFSAFVMGVVNSEPFRMRRAEAAPTATEEAGSH